jgi:hypothetical protein
VLQQDAPQCAIDDAATSAGNDEILLENRLPPEMTNILLKRSTSAGNDKIFVKNRLPPETTVKETTNL